VIGLALRNRDGREDFSDGQSKVVVDFVESTDGVLVNNVLFALGQLELGGRDHVLLLWLRHRVVEQSSLVNVFLHHQPP
jgi:hypothetical protein